jgi:zinc protease
MLRTFSRKLVALVVALGGVGIFSDGMVGAQATATKSAVAQQDLPKAESLIDKYVAAIGGKEALSNIKSLTVSGSMVIAQAGINGDIEMLQSDGKMLMKIDLPGIGQQTIGFNGEVAWQNSELTGPQLIEGGMLEDLKFQAKIDGYSDAAQYFDSLETVKAVDFEGEAAYEVVAKKKGTSDKTLFFSQKSGLIIGSSGEQQSDFGTMNITTVISDYKKVGSIMMSHKATQKLPNGMAVEMNMKEIKVNEAIPTDKFALPDSIKKLIK